MSEEDIDVSTNEQNDEPATATQAADAKPGKPAGYDPVDPRNATPEEIEDRFKYLYRQVKGNERTLRDFQNLAREQSEVIAQLQSGVGQVVTHLQERTFAETESQLRQQMKEAYDAGDTQKYIEAQDKLDDIRLEKKLAAREPKKEAKPIVPKESNYDDSDRLVDDGDLHYINAWQNEKDETGRLLRPWAHNKDKDNPSEEYLDSLIEVQAVLKSPKFKNKSIEEKMAEVDRRMGMAKGASQPAVMGGNLTRASKPSKITLSEQQQKIALRTVPIDGKKIKNADDQINWYREQVLKAKQGVRK